MPEISVSAAARHGGPHANQSLAHWAYRSCSYRQFRLAGRRPRVGVSSSTAVHFRHCPPWSIRASAAKTKRLCFSEFVLLHSGLPGRRLWCRLERLTTNKDKRPIPWREFGLNTTFHAEKHAEAELEDYQQSGFDRGHMSPNGNIESAQEASFSLGQHDSTASLPQQGDVGGNQNPRFAISRWPRRRCSPSRPAFLSSETISRAWTSG